MKKKVLIFMALPAIVFLFLLFFVAAVLTGNLDGEKDSPGAGYQLPGFVTQDMMQAFFEVQETEGIPVSSGLAQLIAESGFGRYGPGGENGQGMSQLAYDYKNLFGIKYFDGDENASGAVDMTTGEETSGGDITITAGFSVYPNYAACIRQRGWMLTRSPYIEHVEEHLNENNGKYTKKDAQEFIAGVRAAGWATDTSYVEKCIQYMDQYNLYQFDNMTYQEYLSGTGTGGSYGGTVTELMEQLAEHARNNDGTYPCTPDMCAAWVTGIYKQVGAPVIPYGNAIDMWNVYQSTGSTDTKNIPPGAIVCGSGSGYMGSLYGHVGIYLGDGLIAHNAGYHSIQTIEEWSAWQTATCQGHTGWIGWVFPGGVPTE